MAVGTRDNPEDSLLKVQILGAKELIKSLGISYTFLR